jgi:hypothetical protein
MLRAHKEWMRYGKGPWDYSKNSEVLHKFWEHGIRRNKDYESIVTVGMRGDGDMPMSEESNVALLEKIVADQRTILAQNVNPDVTRVPQLWALYKEVQEYFEKGMRVPDDVTLLWCDDNWGNIRRLPSASERARTGGAGVYYHFDYVGGPRSYKWINTIPITKVQEQMNLAWEYGANRIWIVNVGDLKPMEFPIEFFLNFAWTPGRWPAERLADYTRQWAAREFGPADATEIASLISGYTKLNSRRKPEQLEPNTFSLIHYGEAERVSAEFADLARRAQAVEQRLAPAARDAFFQLVLHPILASQIVTDLNITAGLNRLYAVQGRASTNLLAEKARELFERDAELTYRYNEELGQGRWRHMMDQTHLGYTYWQQPPRNVKPAVQEMQVPPGAELAIAVEGSPNAWPGHNPSQRAAELPTIDSALNQTRWIDVFNRSRDPFDFTAATSAPWLKVSPTSGKVGPDTRRLVSVDWNAVPASTSEGTVTVRGGAGEITVRVPLRKADTSTLQPGEFLDTQKYLAIEAEHFNRATQPAGAKWKVLPGFGRTLSGVTVAPALIDSQPLSAASPRLEYDFRTDAAGAFRLQATFAPTLNFQPGRGLRCAVSIDDEEPRMIDVGTMNQAEWAQAVSDGARQVVTRHSLGRAGRHVLKFWFVDPGVVLERLTLDFGGLSQSYLGAPESFRRPLTRPAGSSQ